MRPSAPLVLGCALVLGCGPKQAPEPSVPETTDAGSAQADANAPPPDVRCGVQPDGSRSFRVLHLNDVYRIGGLSDGRGGLSICVWESSGSSLLVTPASSSPCAVASVFSGQQRRRMSFPVWVMKHSSLGRMSSSATSGLGGRFDNNSFYQDRYWKAELFAAAGNW